MGADRSFTCTFLSRVPFSISPSNAPCVMLVSRTVQSHHLKLVATADLDHVDIPFLWWLALEVSREGHPAEEAAGEEVLVKVSAGFFEDMILKTYLPLLQAWAEAVAEEVEGEASRRSRSLYGLGLGLSTARRLFNWPSSRVGK